MKLVMRRLLIFLVVLTMVIPAGLAFAATDDGAAVQGDEAVTVAPEEGEEELPDMEPIDPATLNVHKLGEDLDLEAIKNKAAKTNLNGTITPEQIAEMSEEELNETVRVSIFMEDPAVLDKYTVKQTKNFWAKQYRSRLESSQQTVEKKINKAIGRTLEVKWHLTLAVNAISTEATYAEIAKIYEVKGVKSVEKERRYNAVNDIETAEPNTSLTSTGMTGASATWANGYTGAGTRIAIIDTGIDITHQSFDSGAFDYAIAQLGDASGNASEAKTVELMTAEDIPEGLNGAGIYLNSKIPYIYNYVDQDTDVEHVNDQEGEHGSHVAGIAAANRFVDTNGDGVYEDAAETVFAVGMAPDAQLIVMKVFGKGGGAYDSDYMAAMEDAIELGCDSCNLSLGSSEPGYTYDTTYQNVLNTLSQDNDGMVVSISAGNSGSWAGSLAELTGELFVDDVNMDTVGSPGSFINSLSVASAVNIGITGSPLIFNGDQKVYYTEGKHDITSLANEDGYDYVYIYGDYTNGQGVGTPEEYKAVNEAVSLDGKIVIVSRGDITFVEKGENAIPYNPAAVVVANNQPGTIGMALDDYTGDAPMVSITQDDGLAIANGADDMQVVSVPTTVIIDEETGEEGAGEPYNVYALTGKVNVSKEVSAEVNGTLEDTEISDFSSWGIPGSLLMKPEITAPGGNIYSVNGTHQNTGGGLAGGSDKYELMSGTSMAAPHVAGLSALLLQYIEDVDFTTLNKDLTDNYTNRAIAQSLLMSTAVPMQPNGYLSILQQGSGLVDVSKAIGSSSVIMMDEAGLTTDTGAADDGKVKVELGDDPYFEGEYQYSFTIYNTSDLNQEFELSTDLFTQDIDEEEFLAPYTRNIASSASYTWNADVDVEKHDVDLDGDTDKDDAQAILDYITGEVSEEDVDVEAADMDDDGQVTSKDAKILLTWTPEGYTSNYIVPAHGKAEVTVNLSVTEDLSDYPNGAYIEGYTYAECTTATDEGVDLSTTHSIPILGFYGNWTDASMFDKISYNDYLDALVNEEFDLSSLIWEDYDYTYADYYTYSGKLATNFMSIKHDGNETAFTGNPYMVEEDGFPYDRLAISSDTEIRDFYYNLIRPAGTLGYVASALDEDHNITGILDAGITEYLNPGLWYYDNQQTPMNDDTAVQSVNALVSDYDLEEGDMFRAGFYAVPEYYAMLLNGSLAEYDFDMKSWYSGILYDDVFLEIIVESELMGEGSYIGYDLTIDDTDPVIESAEFDAENGTITVSASDNQNLAYVAVMSVDGATVYQEVAPAKPEADLTFDVTEAIENAQGYVAVFVGDYAGNEAAVAKRVNDAEAPDPTLVSDVVVSPEEINLFQGQSQSLNVKVLPITAENKAVVWSSTDEAIATVSEDGTVTGVSQGITTIKATSAENAEVVGECSVKVLYVGQDLNGILWDEEGEIFYTSFNTSKLPVYSKDSACDIGSMTSAFVYNGNIVSGTLVNSSATTDLYLVNPEPEEGDAYELTKLGSNYMWATDLALGFVDFGTPLAYTYRDYLIMGNLAPRDMGDGTAYTGIPYVVGSFEDTIGSNVFLAGLAYKGDTVKVLDEDVKALYQSWYEDEYEAYYPDDSYYAPDYYILDENGCIWEVGTSIVYDEETGYDDVAFTTPELVADTGIKTNFQYQSLYYDGEYIYWSHYDDGDYAHLYVIIPEDGELFEAGELYEAGNFGAKVWPVSGLYEMPAATEEDENASTEAIVAAKEANKVVKAENLELLNASGDRALEELKYATDAEGTLNAAKTAASVEKAPITATVLNNEEEPVAGDDEGEEPVEASGVEVVISEQADSTNGFVTVTFDPLKIGVAETSSELEYESIHVDNEAGKIYFAYANATPIDKETVLASILFNDACEDTTLKVVTTELNDDLALDAYREQECAGSAHIWDEGEVTTPATSSSVGIITYSCEKCECTREETFKNPGWFKDENGNWTYVKEDGTNVTGWKKVSGKWYYFDAEGIMQTGWKKVSGKWYYFNKSGVMQTGWQKISDKWYYFNTSGAMQTGWQKIDGKWYYFNDSGVMQTGWQKIDGKDYYFKASGIMAANEWVTGYWWLGSSGAWTYKYKAKWEKTADGHWMFKASNGWTAKNTTIIINDVSYTFDANGYMK